jgi:hypothetical protein
MFTVFPFTPYLVNTNFISYIVLINTTLPENSYLMVRVYCLSILNNFPEYED